jgi:putative colanic acid biosynthesis acetyltransferase WcaF
MLYQDLSSFKVPKNFRGGNKFKVQLWDIVHFFLFRPSPQFMYGYRNFLLRIFGAKIGKKVLIRSSVKITYPWKLVIGDNTWIGEDCYIYNLENIHIGSNVSIAHRNFFNTGGHDYNKATFDIFAKPIKIEDKDRRYTIIGYQNKRIDNTINIIGTVPVKPVVSVTVFATLLATFVATLVTPLVKF